MRKVETLRNQLKYESDVDDGAQVGCLSPAPHADLAALVQISSDRIHALEAARASVGDQFAMLK
jgi:hypothetical protein